MEYEEAVKRWALEMLSTTRAKFDKNGDIRVEFEFDSGYECCGYGNAEISYTIHYKTPSGRASSLSRSVADITELLREFVAATSGS